jgi:hypothetical protein
MPSIRSATRATCGELLYLTKGHLELDWDGCVIRVDGEMTVRPDGFEVFDDLPVRVLLSRDEGVGHLPLLSDVLAFVRQEFATSGLTLFMRSDRLGM